MQECYDVSQKLAQSAMKMPGSDSITVQDQHLPATSAAASRLRALQKTTEAKLKDLESDLDVTTLPAAANAQIRQLIDRELTSGLFNSSPGEEGEGYMREYVDRLSASRHGPIAQISTMIKQITEEFADLVESLAGDMSERSAE
jgi:hypothetical protein